MDGGSTAGPGHLQPLVRDEFCGLHKQSISIMKLVQILLPVRDNRGRKFKGALYSDVHSELVRRFGGLTAYTRSPARGLWKSEGSTKRDDMIILEVMTKRFDRTWWKKYRQDLESKFRQDEIIVRAHEVTQV
jgi:hypothetical protein